MKILGKKTEYLFNKSSRYEVYQLNYKNKFYERLENKISCFYNITTDNILVKMAMKFIILILGFFASLPVNSSSSSSSTLPLKWESLVPGDKIAIVATSNIPNEGCLAKARELLIVHNFIPLIFVHSTPGEFGRAPIEDRRQDFYNALKSEAKVIWAIRGGRGASEIFEEQELFAGFRAKLPKLLIGFSDFTSIHLWANSIGWPSLHGIVLSYCLENSHVVNARTSIAPYIDILTGKTRELTYQLQPENELARTCSIETTCVIGGNSSLIQRSIGTETMPTIKGNVLFIEDIGEEGSRLNEVLVHFSRSSFLKEVKAIIWGNFESKDVAGIADAKTLFIGKMTKKNISVFSADFFGHGAYNYPLPLNTTARIEVGGKLVVRTNNWSLGGEQLSFRKVLL